MLIVSYLCCMSLSSSFRSIGGRQIFFINFFNLFWGMLVFIVVLVVLNKGF